MKRILKIIAALLAVTVAVLACGAWWLMRSDRIEPPDLPGVVDKWTLEHDGLSRTWLAYIPDSLPAKPALVLLLHGSRGDGARMRDAAFHSFNVVAEREGFIAVYPDGYERHWNDCRGGASYAANLQNIDDVGFLRALVRQMEYAHGVDRSRVFAAGLSNGGQMAYRLGFEAPDLVAGIASIAANLPVPENFDCTRSGRPVATLILNGTEDPINPYHGGLVEIRSDSSRGLVLSAVESARYWAQLSGHDGEGEHRVWPERAPDDRTSVESRTWSAPGKPSVQLLSIVGGGHTIPNPVFNLPRILGATSHELDGAEAIWEFFSSPP